MKNLLFLLLMCCCLPFSSQAQSLCPNNIFINGDLSGGTPTPSDQDIDNAVNFSRIWPSGSLADYYIATAGPFTPPTPATGNYVSCWIANHASGGTTYREGFQAGLMFTLPPNTGTYTLTFDMACLGGWGNSEVAVYGVRNMGGVSPVTPTGAFTPANDAFFGAANTVLLSTIPVSSSSCSNTKTTQTVTINTNAVGYPANGVSHIMITHSDNNSINGALYMAFDDFCLSVQDDCQAGYTVNGDLESGTPTASDQDIDNAANFSRIWPNASNADYYIATGGPFTPPTPATGNYASCWIANYNGGGTTYREGFQSELAATIAPNTGNYTLEFDMACLHSWGVSEVAVYGVNNTVGVSPVNTTGAFTPANSAFFGAANTMLLGTINLSGTCSNTKTTQTINFSSSAAGFPAAGMTHFFITHSDNSSINGAWYMAFDNFCLQSNYTPPCPKITNTEAICIGDVDGDGVPDYQFSITVDNPGALNLFSSCGTISPSSITAPTAGTYTVTVVSNGLCSPFEFKYESFDVNGNPCFEGEEQVKLPECPKDECKCDESFYDAVNQGFFVITDNCPNIHFRPRALLSDCDKVFWYVDGTLVGSTMENGTFVFSLPPGVYEICMLVERTSPDGSTCKHEFCTNVIIQDCVDNGNFLKANVSPNPADNELVIKWDTRNVEARMLSISILNVNGTVIKQYNTVNSHASQFDLDVSSLAPGIYLIRIEGENYAPGIEKFIKR